MKNGCYENYPLWMVLLSNALSISIYIAGTLILYQFGIIFAVLYLVFCLFMEIRLLKNGCVNCYYYGKTCAFGKGRLSSYFFKRGDVSLFSAKEISWYHILADFMVSLLPLAGGIILLINKFDWIILLLIIIILILALGGNAFIRSLSCKNCKQRELGCPAADLFGVE